MRRELLGTTLLLGCVLEGDGQVVADAREVGWFDALEVFGGFEVEAAVDPALAGAEVLAVEVEGESNLLDRLFTVIHGEGVLSIAVDPNLRTRATVPPRAVLTAPALRAVFATDRSRVTVSGAGGALAIAADRAAAVTASGLSAGEVTVTGRGSSAVVIAGAGPQLVVNVGDAASVDAGAFAADAVTVTVAGTASVVVCTTGQAPTIVGDAAQVTVACAP